MESKPLVPNLRFPEFRQSAPWDALNGNHLFDTVDRRPAPLGLPVLAITQEQGAISRDDIDYHVSVTAASIASYKEVRPADFIISLRSFQGGIEYSRVHGICSPAYVILKRKGDGSDDFYRQLFKSPRFIQQITRNIEGLRDGKMISYKQFSEQLLPAPSPAEQKKIAECLTSLDELIAAEGRKLDALRTYKKGLMQNLFPCEGETTPRLRFPEFRDAGEWCESTVGEQAVLMSGFPFDGGEILENSKGVPLMRGINITEGMVRHNPEIDRYFLGPTDKLEKYVLRESDLVIGMDGSKVGKNSALISKRDVGALLVQRVARLRTEDPTTNVFMFQIINSRNYSGTESGFNRLPLEQCCQDV
jgi:type I restriction enzyme S subunit